jgi:hypothetical protein
LSETYHVGEEKSNVFKLVNRPVLVLNDAQDMERDKLADELVCLLNFNFQNLFVVKTLSLDHLTMMDSNTKEDSVHDLSQDELNDLIFKHFSLQNDHNEPSYHISGICDDKVAQKNISHHENQR